jgi:nucleotidyltransferase substrate binding protein (TIGR01987 family)
MKDFAEFQGMTNIAGSRDATREAFKMGLIIAGDNWMSMLESRKLTSHTYNSETANEIFVRIVTKYYKLFLDFETKMASLNEGSSGNSLKQQ